ncbi:MAG: PepSY domain-containing protein [Synergistaceae bacterium]|nr:PepSY domain-containing protein [Synergistaceae bacterium]
MKKLLCAVMAVLVALSGISFAHDGREEQYVRGEAARRNMKLISRSEAERIAAERIHESGIRFKDADLEDDDDYYRSRDDFRPVWSIEAVAGGQEYDIDIDAVTGEILKFKLDD